jgi:DNA-binding protein
MVEPVKKDQQKLLTPKDNKLQINIKKSVSYFSFLSKIFLKNFDQVEIHALGSAISTAVRVAETLQSNSEAVIENISLGTFPPENQKPENDKEQRTGKKMKIIITIKKGSNFDHEGRIK